MTDQSDEEWLAQESALREGRDPRSRLLARVLAEPMLAPLPDDFAARVTRLARQPRDDDRVEAWLQYGLLGLLALLGMEVAWPMLAEWQVTVTGDSAMPDWLSLVLLCLALSAAPGLFGPRWR